MKDKRYDELAVTVENVLADMRKIKEVHVVLAQQVQQIKGVCEQLNVGMIKQAEMMGRFTKAAADNTEMVQVVGEEMKVIQADQNAYRNRMNEINIRMGSIEKLVRDSFKKLSDAFSSVSLPTD